MAFSSLAADLVGGDTNGSQDVFVRDRVTGQTVRLPVNGREPGPPGGRASDPAISPDGGFVAFTYQALAPAASVLSVPSGQLVLLWDSASGSTRIASLDRNGRPAVGSSEPAISQGGRFVAYTSTNSDITPGDANKLSDVFRVDTQTGATTMVSQTPSGTSPRGASRSPAISADGSIVAFSSNAPNILTPDRPPPSAPPSSPPTVDAEGVAVTLSFDRLSLTVNVHDCDFEVTNPDGGIPGPLSFTSSEETRNIISVHSGPGAGQQVLTVDSAAPTLGGVSQSGVADCHSSGGGISVLVAVPTVEQVYARNVPVASTELVSVTPSGAPGLRPSVSPAISADGAVIAFISFDSTLAAGDADALGDVYIRERSFARTTLLTGDLPTVGHVAISGNGQFVVFESATGPGGNGVEVYHRDRFDGATILVSTAIAGGGGGPDSFGPVVSAEGRYVAWTSTSSQLIADDGNGVGDVFVRDLPPAGTIDPPVLDFGTRALGTVAPAGAVTLTSVGWTPLGSIVPTIVGVDAGDFALVSDGCTGALLPRPQSCTMTVQFSPQDVGPRSATLQVVDNGFGSPHTVGLVGAGSNAELTLDPPSGPPGIVTIAEGKGFPPNIAIVLSWTVGINQRHSPVVTDGKGAFRTQVLVFRHDVEGPRDLVASPADGKSFRPIAVDFFVSKPTGEPPGWSDPTVFGYQPPRGWFQQ